jgi:hypothetical protein
MKNFLRSTVEALHYLYSGDPDDKDEVPLKEKKRGVIIYSIIMSIAIFLYWLFSQR